MLTHHLICTFKTNTSFWLLFNNQGTKLLCFMHNVGKGGDHDLSPGSKTPISVHLPETETEWAKIADEYHSFNSLNP